MDDGPICVYTCIFMHDMRDGPIRVHTIQIYIYIYIYKHIPHEGLLRWLPLLGARLMNDPDATMDPDSVQRPGARANTTAIGGGALRVEVAENRMPR